MKKKLLFLVVLHVSAIMYSENFKVDNLYYKITSAVDLTVGVISPVYPDIYTGDIIIPSSVVYNNTTYSVHSIEWNTFWGYSINSITIPTSVTSIGDNAFYGCTGLTSIIIPSSIKYIGYESFFGCKGLESVKIPSSVHTIGNLAFGNCTRLNSIIVDDSNTAYSSENGILFNKIRTELICYPLGKTETSYSIPSSVTQIGFFAFLGCTTLTSVIIPSSVSVILDEAFHNCSALKSISIPSLVTKIGDGAFYGCTALNSIYLYNPTPIVLTPRTDFEGNFFHYVFGDVNKTSCILYVPQGTKASYQVAIQWQDFPNIIEFTTSLQPIIQSSIKIMIDYGKLEIENAPIGSKLEVFTISGQKIKENIIENYHTYISLSKGDYVLRIGNYSDKVVIK